MSASLAELLGSHREEMYLLLRRVRAEGAESVAVSLPVLAFSAGLAVVEILGDVAIVRPSDG